MLLLTIPARELWDEIHQEFIYIKGQTIQLEHSLVSLSKWEAQYGKPFLSKEEKTREEIVDYIRCMTLTRKVDPETYDNLTEQNFKEIQSYIDAPMTATSFSHDHYRGNSGEQTTAELIYYWMIALNIPHEYETWHLNRLLTLIQVCNIKNQPPKKRNRREIMKRNSALNQARRNRYGTRG